MSSLQPNLRLRICSYLIIFGFFIIVQNIFRSPVTYNSDFILGEESNHDLQKLFENGLKLAENQQNNSKSLPGAQTKPMLRQHLKKILKCKDRPLLMEKHLYGTSYWLVSNFVRGSISKGVHCAESITYTTHGDHTFFDTLPIVASRWLAPISFAIFAPGYDMIATMDSIQYVRNCLEESELIRKYVTFHVYFPVNHMPSQLPITESKALRWPFDCSVKTAPYSRTKNYLTYRAANNLTYPINVGRNIARKAANTHFIFACDIELFPSFGLVPKFLDMIERNSSSGDNKLRVFVLPVFELKKYAILPKSKTELVAMSSAKMAIPFHSKVCTSCHLVPQQTEWMAAKDDDNLTVFAIGKREQKFKIWEPFYISNNREPMFDERVTCEGQSNKRIQGYAMCLLGYEYHVLHPAFLVHNPGIKYFNKKSPRLKYVKKMNELIRYTIESEYRILYGSNSNCGT